MLRNLEEMLGREDRQIDIGYGDLRLKRDRNKRVSEVWVRWKERPHLSFRTGGSSLCDRSCDRAHHFRQWATGQDSAGGGGDSAQKHRAGGGSVGNVAARTISQLLGAVPGVQAVFNPRAGEGGADGETLERFSRRAPKTVRHRGRAIAPSDYETMAHEASPAVGVARAIPTRNPSGRPFPGWVTLLIIPLSKEPRPWPSFGLREDVRRYIEQRAPAELAAAQRIYVTGPDYLPVDVEATIAPIDSAEAGSAGQRAQEALQAFLHPLHGGPDRRGFDLGRDLFLSDVAAVLERVPDVDYVEDLALYLNGLRQDERIAIADDRVVVAGEIRLKLKAAEA